LTRARVVSLLVVAAVVSVAIAVFRQYEPRADPEVGAAALPQEWTRTDTLGKGEALATLFLRGGLGAEEAARAMRAATALDERRIPAGLEVVFRGDASDERPRDIALHLSSLNTLRLSRAGDSWGGRLERISWTTDTLVVHGVVRSTLYGALDQAASVLLPKGARAELAWTLADIYEYRIDMSRDLQDGDAVRVVFERGRSPAGAVRIGAILAAGVQRNGRELQAIRFLRPGGERAEYYDKDGRSLRAAFLRAPLSFRRISSVFGMRKHPILGEWRAHKGTDYAANAGTPVRSIGDGVVTFAGRRGGYGNAIEVRHPNGFVTRYGHLRAFAAGTRVGARVAMGRTIGFVGMTGLATAPHLHFEVLVGGAQRDPRTALRESAGVPIAASDAAFFERVRVGADGALDHAEGVLHAAAAPAPAAAAPGAAAERH
jgi:murein DD-endopeptidase MepM/ murein hydrolase activator NlpD